MLEEIRQLFDYDRWADERLLAAVGELSDEDFRRDLKASFRSIHGTVAHLIGAEWVWLRRWKGESPAAFPGDLEAFSLKDLRTEWLRNQREREEFLASLEEGELHASFGYRTFAGVEMRSPLWQSMRHVVNHSTYHRGQIALMLRQVGARPVSTDLILYYREAAPAP